MQTIIALLLAWSIGSSTGFSEWDCGYTEGYGYYCDSHESDHYYYGVASRGYISVFLTDGDSELEYIDTIIIP